MPLKKRDFKENEIPIFDDACIYKRGDYWQFRMWLEREGKYARKSLRTRSEATAVERARQMYLEIFSNQQQGKTYFSLTVKEGVQKYLEARNVDVELGLIVRDRYVTIRSQLKHWLDFIGKDSKLKELERTDCEDYFQYRNKKTRGTVKNLTVQHEQSTINACVRWLNKKGETHIDSFDFKKLPRIDRGNEAIRKATLTNEEYERLTRVMRPYCAKKNNKNDESEILLRKLIQHYVLIASNSGLRVGEQMQLKWSDVKVEEHKDKTGEPVRLARIHVRAETSKVRTSSIFLCRNGHYFERWKEIVGHANKNGLIFSVDGEKPITKRQLLYHFKKMVEQAGIPDLNERDIVPYSLRHFMITQRIMSGLSYRQVADMCGTSVAQIERTYYHLNDEIRLTNAVADFRRREDGTIEVM